MHSVLRGNGLLCLMYKLSCSFQRLVHDFSRLVRHFPIAYTFCEVPNFLIQGV